jgi:hypothetical protein
MKIAGSGTASGSGSASKSIRQRYGSVDQDPYQNFIDAQHCFYLKSLFGTLIQKSKTRLTQIEKNKNIFKV